MAVKRTKMPSKAEVRASYQQQLRALEAKAEAKKVASQAAELRRLEATLVKEKERRAERAERRADRAKFEAKKDALRRRILGSRFTCCTGSWRCNNHSVLFP